MRTLPTLRLAAAVEAFSLALLLGNLLTVHTGWVTSLGGPTHGTAYLVTVLAVRLTPGPAARRARPLALVPGVGGLLALRRLRAERPPVPAG
ncbi:hypothetical protein ACF064_00185 [Streptomyces sp. NPDC015492]|uniref:hypothetical protein n=1 Tax=unclassified Streptomyces TaxID=2593676 RepID=UPI0036F4FDB6